MTDHGVNPSSRVLVIGGGYTGQRFAAAARARGAQVWLTSRSAQEEPHWLRFNAGEGAIPELPEALSHVLITLPPNGDGEDDAYNVLRASLELQPLEWVGYLSTTGVYGDTQGQWADEGSPTQPGLRRSQSRLQCEQRWLASALPLQSFRLPAIYGPGRCPFQQLEQGTARLIHKPQQVFCRIHVDDIVGALLHCCDLPAEARPTVVNVSDDLPCPSSETLGYAAHLLGCKLPAVRTFQEAQAAMSPMALSFWADNRRVSNALLCQKLGYRLRYPTYREGFAASWDEERSRPK